MTELIEWVYLDDFFEIRTKEDPIKWIPLVCKIACKYSNLRPIQDSEEYSDGIVALLRAVKNYDPYRGYKFITYAWYAIRREILRGVISRNRKDQVLYDRESFFEAAEVIQPELEDLEYYDYPEFQDLLTTLNDRELFIVSETVKGRVLREMAVELRVTKERVRQIREQAYIKLRLRQIQYRIDKEKVQS